MITKLTVRWVGDVGDVTYDTATQRLTIIETATLFTLRFPTETVTYPKRNLVYWIIENA